MSDGKKIINTDDKVTRENLNIVVPDNLSILYTDLVSISSNEFGFVFDFAQSLGPTNQRKVVSRVGMSKEHAIAFLNALSERLKMSLKISGQKN